MLKLKRFPEIVAFCLVITAFGIGVATALEYTFYYEEFITTAPGKKAIFVSLIAIPISALIALIIRRNTLLTEELTHLVNRDRLTDVATRDFFFACLALKPKAYGVSLMVDIDHFKQVNDTHGHLTGDTVIAAVAEVLQSQIREQDIVCRFGGEEFLIYLHEPTTEEGWEIAERIRVGIQDKIVQSDAGNIPVTVSVGGSLKSRLEEIEHAIRRADECLYRAKALGRNRTVVEWDMSANVLPIKDAPILRGAASRRKNDALANVSAKRLG